MPASRSAAASTRTNHGCAQADALRPVVDCLRVWPARSAQPLPQVLQVGLGDLYAEGDDLGTHSGNLTDVVIDGVHTAQSLSHTGRSTPPASAHARRVKRRGAARLPQSAVKARTDTERGPSESGRGNGP